jgi:hypothetical protein
MKVAEVIAKGLRAEMTLLANQPASKQAGTQAAATSRITIHDYFTSRYQNKNG